MHITWYGQSCFQIIITRGKGEQTSVVIDPFDASFGLKAPNVAADILLISRDCQGQNNKAAIKGVPFLIKSPGEYEIKDVFIRGISDLGNKGRAESVIYSIEAEGMRLCHFSFPERKELAPRQLEALADIDILMLAAGGRDAVAPKEAAAIVSQIEPKIVIPMRFQIPKLRVPNGKKPETAEMFLKALGQKPAPPQSKLSIKRKDLSEERLKAVVLAP